MVYPRGLPLPAAPGVSRFCWVGATADFFLHIEKYRLGWVTTVEVTYPSPIRVLIVDDHPLVRRGLTSLLNGTTDIKVVGAASDGEEAVAYAVEEHPDIVLMDISMPGMNGFEALRRMLKAVAGTKVVMLTSYSEHDMVVEAIDNGAVGFLLKDTEPQELLNGIRSAAKRRPLDDLTQRELDVLTLVGRGMSNKQIAWRLGISEKTVKAHLGSVFDRLGVEDRVQAALWAQRHGII